MRITQLVAVAATMLLTLELGTTAHARSGGETSGAPSPRLALWSEFIPYSELSTQLPKLRELDVSLIVAVTPAALETEDFFDLWARAESLGVEIRPWLLLDVADGYWTNAWNPTATIRVVDRFVARMTEHGLHPAWITLDLEPPPTLLHALEEQSKRKDLLGMRRVLLRSGQGSAFCESKSIYRELVQRIHQAGIRVQAVTGPFALHDRHGRASTQRALGIPIEGIDWDEVSFMLYRVEMRAALGSISPDIVYAYARRAKRAFGARAAVDLGEVGPIVFPVPKPGYTDPRDLQRDMAATRAAGIEKMHIYGLDGLRALSAPLEDWLSVPASARPRLQFKARAYLTAVDIMAMTLPRANCR